MTASREWGPSQYVESVEENKRKIMKSNIFGDSTPTQKSFSSKPNYENYNRESPSKNNNNNNTYYEPPINKNNNFSLINSTIRSTNLPSLSPFPEIKIETPKTIENFDLGLKPRIAKSNNSQKKLNFIPSNQMKILRDNLAQDLSSFSNRMQKLSSSQPIQLNSIKNENLKPKLPHLDNSKSLKNENLRQSQDDLNSSHGFSIHSEFILPDGTSYQ